MEDLKPCPFCGSTKLKQIDMATNDASILCESCQVWVMSGYLGGLEPEKFAETWNNRAKITPEKSGTAEGQPTEGRSMEKEEAE